jgi:hypothetical protein
MKRADKVVELMYLFPQLRDPHSEFLMLQRCMGITKVFFNLKMCQRIHMDGAVVLFDKKLQAAIEDIVLGDVISQ